MSSTNENISQVKFQLQNVIKNLKTLEAVAAGTLYLDAQSINELKAQTDAIINKLEKTPATKIHKIVKKRRNKRKRRKIRRKLLKKATVNAKESTINNNSTEKRTPTLTLAAEDTPTTSKIAAITTKSNAPKVKEHHQLLYQYHGQRFLRTFELLKMLHLARGQNLEDTRLFNAKFNNLREKWNNILQKNIMQKTQTHKIVDQWNEVFFGAKERVYYTIEQNQNDFLRIRRTWDTYLTRSSKHGSSIPTGWVLPKESVDERWLAYRKK